MARRKAVLPAASATAAPAPQAQPSWAERKSKRGFSKAYQVLADQPISLRDLPSEQRAQVVVSAVLADDGSTVVVSWVVDRVWDLWPFVETPNTAPSAKRLDWSRLPEGYRESVQNVLYRYWKVGRTGWGKPGVTQLRNSLGDLSVACHYFAGIGLRSFAEVLPLHVANFIHTEKSAGLALSTLALRFSALQLLWLYRDEHRETLGFDPLQGASVYKLAGLVGQEEKNARKVSKTPLIPPEMSKKLFLHCEAILKGADAVLDVRDAGKRAGINAPELTAIRDACFYLVGVLTGMRQSEITGIEVGAGRTEVKNGITFHWVTSVEHKTKKGRVDYLMPLIGHEILRILERWSAPYRARLAERIVELERSGSTSAKDLAVLDAARKNRNRLFLGAKGTAIQAVSANRWGDVCKLLAEAARVDWELAPHQMRRLYAYTFARHRLGSLLFLKEQFKHSSLDMSQLYAADPYQDTALYDEVLEELVQAKCELVTRWIDADEPLAGGAGRKIMALRAHAFDSRKGLIEETADFVSIRSTGHSWCLAQDEDCGGSGIYEKGRCGGCHNGLIDRTFVPIWHEAFRHHKEVLKDAESLGPGAVKRVRNDLMNAERILRDLGEALEEELVDGEVTTG